MTQISQNKNSTRALLGVDTGGTFTDLFWYSDGECRIHKVLSTPDAPERAILQGIKALGVEALVARGEVAIVHGSTVATNAALEGKGVRTAYVTNRGFADTLTLGRQNRSDIYALQPAPKVAPVPRKLCVEVDCRRDATAQVVQALSEETLAHLLDQLRGLQPEAVAINLLFSYLNSEDEQRIEQCLQGEGWFVCRSSDVLAEYKEYERGMATWLNAWLGLKVESYLQRLLQGVSPSPLAIMQSHGGTIAAEQASRHAVNLLLSGPAGGLAAAKHIGAHIGQNRLMTFDMGGTSTDVALIDGDIRLTSESFLADFPVAVPMVDMHTIGAGGGSLAYLDSGGMLHVGPESAGASPGPACYGQGGTQPTVTDANAVLGRLRPEYFLGGRMPLDQAAAENALGVLASQMNVTLLEAARGVVALANEHMVAALRVISVQKGYNPADFDLCCFGGAGGLHVCALAEELGMSRALIPANGGVLSAFGMLVAPRQRQLSRSVTRLIRELDMNSIRQEAAELERQGLAELHQEGVQDGVQSQVSLDCRYQGQSFYLNLPLTESIDALKSHFHEQHQSQYGHRLPLEVELVNIRIALKATGDGFVIPRWPVEKPAEPLALIELPELGKTAVYERQSLAVNQVVHGPAIICEEVSTTLVASGWLCRVDEFGHLRLSR